MSNGKDVTMGREGDQPSTSLMASDSKGRIHRISAKRKYWIEWECSFDKFPSKEQLDKIFDAELRIYIANYLDKLAKHQYELYPESKGSGLEGGREESDVFEQIKNEIKDFFGEDGQDPEPLLGFNKWDGSQWTSIQRKEYYEIVKSNIKKKPGEKQALNYTVFTKKWLSIFKSEWVNVADSHSVFSYRGWFVTRNRIRLTDDSGENRGSMNPPNPPPPPK